MHNISSDNEVLRCHDGILKNKEMENKFFNLFLYMSFAFIILNGLEPNSFKGSILDNIMTGIFIFLLSSIVSMFYGCRSAIAKLSEDMVTQYLRLIYKDEDYGSDASMRNILLFPPNERISVHELSRRYMRSAEKRHYLKSAKIMMSIFKK